MKYFFILISTILMVSCSVKIPTKVKRGMKCNRKLQKVIAKCPELIKKDTIFDSVIVNIPEIKVDTFISLVKDTDVIISVDTFVNERVITKEITYRSSIEDTIMYQIDGIVFKFFDLNGDIGYSVNRPDTNIVYDFKRIETKIEPIEISFLDKVSYYFNRNKLLFLFFSIVFILIVLFFRYI